MRVLRIHAPATPPALAESVGRAVREFNRGLDIRLRFLSIGIDETVLDVKDAAQAAEAVSAELSRSAPDVVILFGDGAAALAAASCAVRERALLVRAGAGRRDGPDADASRAIDRIAAVHLVHGPAAAAALDAESAGGTRVDVGAAEDPAAGEKIVQALSRARRASPGGNTGGV
jgi:UDP-N-acetylglucosamine 2-epimerase